jgi:KaiC/GvpD/RAD55 family RecA-like ATPase
MFNEKDREKKEEAITYNTEVQKLFLEFMVQDPVLYTRVQNIYNPENFDKSLKKVAKFLSTHAEDHSILPDKMQIKAVTGVGLEPIENMHEGHADWFLNEFEKFTKRQELERAILKSADLLHKGDYEPVEKLIKDAVQISLTKDMGLNYFENPRERIERVRSAAAQHSTGWKDLDFKLFGGVNRGEISIFVGASGTGKSIWLQNQACNWTQAGLNGVYITLELSEELCAMRIDAMVTGYATKEIFKNLDDVELKLGIAGKKSGSLHIKYMPSGSAINSIRAYVKELEIKTGKKVDFIILDYLDLLMPSTVKVDPANLFIKDKYVTEELRNLAKELNVLMATASQIGRAGIDEVEFSNSQVAGGISKVYTADNVYAIYTSRAYKEMGKYQLQLLKTRSSTGVGSKVDFAFDVETMRISDTEQDAVGELGSGGNSPSKALMDKIKGSSSLVTSGSKPVITGDIQTAKIKNLLENLKKS